jgi:hypothetical protein
MVEIHAENEGCHQQSEQDARKSAGDDRNTAGAADTLDAFRRSARAHRPSADASLRTEHTGCSPRRTSTHQTRIAGEAEQITRERGKKNQERSEDVHLAVKNQGNVVKNTTQFQPGTYDLFSGPHLLIDRKVFVGARSKKCAQVLANLILIGALEQRAVVLAKFCETRRR